MNLLLLDESGLVDGCWLQILAVTSVWADSRAPMVGVGHLCSFLPACGDSRGILRGVHGDSCVLGHLLCVRVMGSVQM